jgi:hypothetical protein
VNLVEGVAMPVEEGAVDAGGADRPEPTRERRMPPAHPGLVPASPLPSRVAAVPWQCTKGIAGNRQMITQWLLSGG